MTAKNAEPHPPSRQCMCGDCAPSFEPAQSEFKPSNTAIKLEARAKLQGLREEFARRTVERAPAAWMRLHLDTRTVLLMLAGVDPAQDQELADLALKDWREFSPAERASLAQCADALRWQLHGARDLMQV